MKTKHKFIMSLTISIFVNLMLLHAIIAEIGVKSEAFVGGTEHLYGLLLMIAIIGVPLFFTGRYSK
jgi:hypothetical protein